MKPIFTLMVMAVCAAAFAQNTNFGTGAGNGGNFNTSIGFEAGDQVTGSLNTFVGHRAGENVSGDQNTIVGASAGLGSLSGDFNSMLGMFSGLSTTTGSHNAFFGWGTGLLNTTGFENVYVGSSAGVSNTTGRENAFLGFKAGNSNSTGYHNVFVGHESGLDNTTGYFNAFFGANSGWNNTTGIYNTFLGQSSGSGNTTGRWNVYVGYSSGSSGVSSEANVIVGHGAGPNTQDAAHNVMLGAFAGQGSNGERNVFIGYKAGHLMNGSDLLHIANDQNSDLIFGDFSKNHVSIGGIANVATQNLYSLVVFGDALASGVWIDSDSRYKKNQQVITGALQQLNRITGKTYEYKSGQAPNGRKFKSGKRYGFIGQEMQEVFPDLVRADDDGYLSVDYIGMIPVLTESIKELSDQLSGLKEENELLLTWIREHREELSIPQDLLKGKNYLHQNYPNPANGESIIPYELPEDSPLGSIHLYDLHGKEMQVFEGLTSKGSITIRTDQMENGIYQYVLLIGGQVVQSKKLVVSK